MKKSRKKLMGLLLAALMVVGTTANVFATTTSSDYASPKVTLGKWWSGYDENDIYSITANSTGYVYGNYVGLNLKTTSVGMMEGYVHSRYRDVQIELKEDDNGAGNANELVKIYKGIFDINASGIYTIESFGATYYTTACIETNKVAELYVRINVASITGDTKTYAPTRLFTYQYWAV